MAAVIPPRVQDLSIEFAALAERCRAALLEATPQPFSLETLEDWAENERNPVNGAALRAAVGEGANVYALWTRRPGSATWIPQYVGQRRMKSCRTRLREHLFRVDPRTESKLGRVQAAISAGQQVGITTILVRPDELRTAVEQWIIGRATASGIALPWNTHAATKSGGR